MSARMQSAGKWIAMLAVACHVLLSGLAPSLAAASAAFDPASVTCLNSHQADEPEGSALPGAPSAHNCGECMLCGSGSAPAAPVAATAVTFSTRPADALTAQPQTAHHKQTLDDSRPPRGPPALG